MPPDWSSESDTALSEIDRLFATVVAEEPARRDEALARLCAAHPHLGADLSARYRLLAGVGFLGGEGPAADALPERIGAFRILGRLGGGGMGVVYLAEHEPLGRRVALKTLRPEFLGSERARARFRREGHTLSRLDHPGICPVYEVGEAGGVPFLAMRYLDGRTLAELLADARRAQSGSLHLATGHANAKSPSTDRDRVLAIAVLFEQIARAVHAAHEAGLVHRDLKPSNVILMTSGEPVVLDFGLALDAHDDVGLTRTGDVLGTPAYLAPEQIDAGRAADRRTDVYALGVTLYECLTLSRPFAGATRNAVYAAILAGEATPVRTRNRSVPPDLALVLAKAMERAPERRYATALALAEDLRRVHCREPIMARPAGLVSRTCRWTQRHPLLAAFVALLFVALTVTTALVAWLDAALTRARSIAIANLAVDVGERDPKAGLWLARQALAIEEHRQTRSQLYKMLARSHEICRFRHADRVLDVDLANDNKRLLTASGDGAVRIWDARDAQAPPRVLRLKWRVEEAAFVGGSERVFAGSQGGTWGIWDVATGRRLHGEDEGKPIYGVNVAPDARTGLVRRINAPFLVDLDSGRTRTLQHPGTVWCGAFSGDGTQVATAIGWERGDPPVLAPYTVRVWRVADGEQLAELVHGDKVRGVVFLPGDRLLTVGEERRARVWDLRARAVEKELGIPIAAWHAAAAPADGATLVAIGGVTGAWLWHPQGETVGVGVATEAGMVRRLAFAPDGRRLLVGSFTSVAGLYTGDGELLRRFHGHAAQVHDVALSADGRMAVSGSWDHTARLWRIADEDLAPFGTRGSEAYVAVAADGAVLHGDGHAFVVDAGTAVPVDLALHLYRNVSAPQWNSSARRIVVPVRPDHVQIHARDGRLESSRKLEGVGAVPYFTAAFVEEQRLLVITSQGRLMLYDCTSQKVEVERQLDEALFRFVHAIAIHPDGRRFALATDAPPGALLFELPDRLVARFGGHRGQVVDVAFAADGTRIATASIDGTACIHWTEDPDREPVPLRGHAGQVFAVAFAPDGRRLVTASEDGTARIWGADGLEWAAIDTGSRVADAAFSPDGRFVYTASRQGGLQRWPAAVDDLADLATRRSQPDGDADAWRAILDGALEAR